VTGSGSPRAGRLPSLATLGYSSRSHAPVQAASRHHTGGSRPAEQGGRQRRRSGIDSTGSGQP